MSNSGLKLLKMRLGKVKYIFVLIILLLAGCVNITPYQKPEKTIDWQSREKQLKDLSSWQSQGSFGIIYRERSDIANFNWIQNGEKYFINIYGPLHISGAQIIGEPGSVVLKESEHEFVTADNPESLVKKEFGWLLPVSNLRYWILAIPAPTKINKIQFDNLNHVVLLEQQGWLISYEDFYSFDGIDLPSKVKLERKDLKIKLAIKSWRLNSTNL